MQIYLLLTENCNLKCTMCIRGKQNGVFLATEKLEALKNDFINQDIVLTGGEPTLHPEFEKIVKSLCKVAKSVTITTNGTYPGSLACLINEKNTIVQVSLDGTQLFHNSIRGAGNFEKTFNTIKMLDEQSIPYCVATVASKKNLSCMLELSELLNALSSMKYWRISYEMPFGSAKYDDMMSAQEWNTFAEHMLDNVHFRMKIQKIFSFELYDKMINLGKERKSTCRGINCGSGKNKVYIYPDLKVYPCTCLTDFCIGDLNDNSLSEILCSENAKPFSEYRLIPDTPCLQCKYKDYCNGGCIGMSYHFFGKLGYGDPRCPLLKTFFDKSKGK